MFKQLPTYLNCLVAFQYKYTINSENECWPWLYAITDRGYGVIKINRIMYRANRIAFYIHNKFINNELGVLHTCDNPICVNYNHLWQGTDLENALDRELKGRHQDQKGEDCPASVLNNQKVNEIKIKLKSNKYTQQQLAKEYHVCQMTISDIHTRKTWKHI